MKVINSITAEPKQEFVVRLDNSDFVTIKVEYVATNRAWFMDFEYDDYKSTCQQITNCPNIIRQAKNIVPFGIGCEVEDGGEPWFIDDFLIGRATLFVLSSKEVDYLEKNLYGKVL